MRDRFLLSPLGDFACILALPLIAGLGLLASMRFVTPSQIYALLFGALSLGHHLPGFMRAYGDRQVYDRHRLMLLWAPPLTFLAMLATAYADFHMFVTLIAAWSLWHGVMQVYGILRAYDARTKGALRLGTVDKCFAWAVCGTYLAFWDQDNAYRILSNLCLSRVGLMPAGAFTAGAAVATLSVAGICPLYFGYHAYLWRRGVPFNPVKLVYAASIIATNLVLWRLQILAPLLVILIHELRHDVEYFAMGYRAGRATVTAHRCRAGLLARLFAGRWQGTMAFVAVSAAYGALHHLNDVLSPDDHLLLFNVFAAFVGTSSLLHYLFDGFIWKQGGPGAAAETRPRRWPRLTERAYQPLAAAALLALFAWCETRNRPAVELRAAGELAALLPESQSAKLALAGALESSGQTVAATVAYRQVLDLNADSAPAHMGLGKLFYRTSLRADAESHFARAVALNPSLRPSIEAFRRGRRTP